MGMGERRRGGRSRARHRHRAHHRARQRRQRNRHHHHNHRRLVTRRPRPTIPGGVTYWYQDGQQEFSNYAPVSPLSGPRILIVVGFMMVVPSLVLFAIAGSRTMPTAMIIPAIVLIILGFLLVCCGCRRYQAKKKETITLFYHGTQAAAEGGVNVPPSVQYMTG